jgi:anthranilate phosphoribosyltransferase
MLMDNKAKDYSFGVRLAEKAIDSGAALSALEKLIKVSNS